MAQTRLLGVFVNWFLRQHLKACAPHLVLLWKGWRETGTSQTKHAGNRNRHPPWLSQRRIYSSTCRNEPRTHHQEGEWWHWPSGASLLHQHWVPGGATRRRVLCTSAYNAWRLALARRPCASTAPKWCSSVMGVTLQGLESHRQPEPQADHSSLLANLGMALHPNRHTLGRGLLAMHHPDGCMASWSELGSDRQLGASTKQSWSPAGLLSPSVIFGNLMYIVI